MEIRELLERRNRLLGRRAPLFYEKPLHIVRGEGVWLLDAAGRRYLDVYNNVPSVGHCHPHVVAALTRQASVLNVHTRYLHEILVEYGEKLTSLFDPSLSMLFLSCSGSEANEVALRMARTCTGKMGIICTNATYHGNTTAVAELATAFNGGRTGGRNVKAVDFPCSYRPLRGLSGSALADAYAAEVAGAIEEFEEEGIGFAALLVCPVFANEGLPDVPPGYMEKVGQLVHDAGGLLIFDEVQAGFGRTGLMWGHAHSGVVPDIVTLGKPMGNGHPLAGTVCRADLGDRFRDEVLYFNTFGGNPVSCAVGLAVLEVIEREDLVANARDVGAWLRGALEGLKAKHALIGDVRGRGLFFGVELVTDRATKDPAPAAASRVVNRMRDEGVLISRIGMNDNILKMRPPLCFQREHAELVVDALDRTLATI